MSEMLRGADADARRIACTRFDAPMVLEAGAGTGKTTALVGRIVAWCLGQGWERNRAALAEAAAEDLGDTAIAERTMSRVVAITFTDRAAVEMSGKVAKALRDLSRGLSAEPLDPTTLPAAELSVPRARALVASLHLLRASTIHGFCSRLLATFPIEAGVHPEFTIDSDGSERDAVVRDCFVEALTALYGANEPRPEEARRALALAEDGLAPDGLHTALAQLAKLGTGADELVAARVGDDAADRARDGLLAALSRTLAVIAGPIEAASACNRRLTAPPHVLAVLRALHGALPQSTGAAALGEHVAGIEEKVLDRLGEWARYNFDSTDLLDAVAGVEREFAEASAALRRRLRGLRKVDVERFTAIATVLGPRLADVHARLQCRGVLGFDELIRFAARLTGDNPDLAAKIAAGIDLLLVDEFQDTDKEQCRLIAAIALDPTITPRPSLFLVGDPKQSIYGWRSADLDAYESLVRRALDGATPQRLSVNFRSVTPILDEVQRLARPLLRYRPGVQPEFQELLTAPRNAGDAGLIAAGRRPVEFWLSDTGEGRGDTRKPERRAMEARAIAADIADLHRDGQIALAKVAILLRATTQQEIYLRELKGQGLPFVVEGDRSFYRRRETIDAAALLTTILDPHDQVPLTAVLRGPLCGVPDAALLPLWQRRLPELASQLGYHADAAGSIVNALHDVARLLPDDLPGLPRVAGWEHAAAHTLTVIGELRRAYAEKPLDRFIEQLRSRLLHEETESARWLGPHRLANIEQLLRRFQLALASEGGGAQAALRALRRAIAEQREEREASVADETLDAVRVLSVHKAKGLTFDLVYVAALDQGSSGRGGDPDVGRKRSPAGDALMLCKAAEFAWAEVDEAATRIAEAEAARVLYVAITRPAKRLVLCGGWSSEPGCGSLSALAATRLGGAPLEAVQAAPHAEFIDEQGVRWLDLSRCEPITTASASAAPMAHDDTGALAAAHRLTTLRAMATARQARALTAPISDEPHADDHEQDAREADHLILPREVKRAAGTLVHRVLELLPVDAIDRDAAWDALIVRTLHGAEEAAAHEARALLERFRRGPLWVRWWTLAPRIVGREVPVLVRPDDVATGGLAGAPTPPLWAQVGSIDLLYLDPVDGTPVIADFKTDADPDPQRYAAQLAAYARAIRRAQHLTSDPRTQLWFIASGSVSD